MGFTTDWFSQNIPIWESILSPSKGNRLEVIELGSYEGRSAIWLLNNLLTHKDSKLHCVDSWNGGGELKGHDWLAVEKRFNKNIKPYGDKVTVHKQSTTSFLKNWQQPVDIIYVDAGHFAPQTLIDSVLSHLILKPGGLIIFDDYLIAGLLHTPNAPKTAIDAFLECFAEEYECLSIGYQVVLRKRIIDEKAS